MATETNSPTINNKTIDWSNIFVLSVCTATASIFISIYVLAMAWYGLKDNAADPMERAARAAAKDLLSINVFSASFGPLGVADFYNDDPLNENSGSTAGGIGSGTSGFVRSYNTVATQMRTAMFIAKKHNLSVMKTAAEADFVELTSLKDALRQKIVSATYANGTGKIYEHIKHILLNNRRGAERLLSLKVQVGTAKGIAQVTEIEAEPEDLSAAKAEQVTSGGKLNALVDLPFPDGVSAFSLHQQPKTSIIVESSNFVDTGHHRSVLRDWALPTAIYIECEFSKPSAPSGKERRTICILPGADLKNQSANERAIGESTSGCFAVCFPQGKPQDFDSLLSIFNYQSWQRRGGQAGQWQKAMEGGVPGAGSLTPPATPALKAMDPSEALSIAFYHWLRTQPTPLSPSKIERLLTSKWQPPTRERGGDKQNKNSRLIDDSDFAQNQNFSEAAESQDNSGLVRESGARLFALNNLSKPAEAGQKALFNCFQASPIKFPPSALPVVVDEQGQPNLPGRKGFDRALALSLMSDLYFTNVAAQDSLATARLIQMSSMRAYKLSKERSFLAQTELDSLSMRQKNEHDEKLKAMLAGEVQFRNSRINDESNEQKKQMRAYGLAQQALVNARTIAGQSFECGAKLYQLTSGGINRLDNLEATENGGYLLGKRFIFRPLNQALQETEITATATKLAGTAADTTSGGTDPRQSKDLSVSPWLRKNMRVFGKIKSMTQLADTALMVEGRSLSEVLASGPPVKKAEALSIVFSPALLRYELKQTAQQSQLLYFNEYPFKGLGIPERQLFYYGQNAYQSASVPTGTVNWSVLVRDLVASKGLNSNHQKLGLPQTPISTGWYKKASNWPTDSDASFKAVQDSGGLACEWQLRAPTMLLNVDDADKGAIDSAASGDVFKGTTLSDPESGQRVPQIPPVSPDLL